MVMEICILALMFLCSAEDIRRKEIALWKIGMFAIVSVIKTVLEVRGGDFDLMGLLFSLLPGAGLLLLSLITRQGIGYGDGLLALCIGPALGLKTLLMGMLVAFFVSSLFSAVLLLAKRVKRNYRLPFVPFLTLGMGVMLLAPH